MEIQRSQQITQKRKSEAHDKNGLARTKNLVKQRFL
jgi:hypothetical protein